MVHGVGRADQAIVDSPQIEANPVSDAEQRITNETVNVPQGTSGNDQSSLKNIATETVGFRDLESKMKSAHLSNQLTAYTYAHSHQGTITTQQTGGAPTNTAKGDELGQAAGSGDLKKIEDLIKAGVDVNSPDSKTGMTPIMQATKAGNLKAMELLIKNNADLNLQDKEKRTAIFHAAQNGKSEAITLLRKHKADPNIPGENAKRTPVMEAAQRGDEKSVRALSEGRGGAEVNKKDVNDSTALIDAANYGNAKTVKALLDQYAEYSATDVTGRSALMEAAKKGNSESTKLLLDRINQLDVPEVKSRVLDAQDEQGRTALTEAVSSGDIKTVKALVNSGARLDLATTDGKTALTIAKEMQQNAKTADAQRAAAEVMKLLENNPPKKP